MWDVTVRRSEKEPKLGTVEDLRTEVDITVVNSLYSV